MAKPKKHYDSERAAARRKQVLDAAEACFLRHGFYGTTMAAISRAARMSVGHIYNYFSSKEDVIDAMCEQEMDGLLERFRAAAADQERFVGELKAVLRERIADDSDSGRSALLRDLMAEVGRNESLTRGIRDFDRRIRDVLRDVFRRHRPDLPEVLIDTRLEVLLVLFHGYAMRGIANPNIDVPAYTAEVDALIEILVASPAPSESA